MAQMNSHQPFSFQSSQGVVSAVPVQSAGPTLIVVMTVSSAGVAGAQPPVVSNMLDNFGNIYTRVRASNTARSSTGKITAICEIWVAQASSPIPVNITLQMSGTANVVGDVMTITPQTLTNQVGLDSGLTMSGNVPLTNSASGAGALTFNYGVNVFTSGLTELILGLYAVIIEAGSTVTPVIAPTGAISIVDTQFLTIGGNVIGIGVVSLFAANGGASPVAINTTIQSGQSAVEFFEAVAVAEGPFQTQPIAQNIFQSALPGSVPAKEPQVATPFAPLNVIQLPLGV